MKQQVNLYQGAESRRSGGHSALRIAAVWVAAAVVAVAAQWWIDGRTATLENTLAELTERQETASAQLTTLVAARSVGVDPALLAELDRATRDLRLSETILDLLAGTGAGDPAGYSAQLRALARQPFEGIWLTGIAVAAPSARTTLEGRAADPGAVPTYLRQLSTEAALAGQRFDAFEIERREPGDDTVRFALHSDSPEAW